MTVSYEIRPDPEQLAELNRRLEIWGANTSSAMRIAINNTANRAKSSTKMQGGGASQRLRARYNIKAAAKNTGTTPVKYINERLKVFRANNRMLIGRVYAYKRGILLSFFRQNDAMPAQVNVELGSGVRKVGRIRETVSKPFYMRAKNGALLLVGRRAKGSPGPRGGKFREARTISVSQAFDTIKDRMMPEVEEEFVTQQVAAARFLLQKLKVPMEEIPEP